jgi:hypothetical protein
MADYFRKYKSNYSSTSNSFSTGSGETITPASVSGLPTDTEITLTFDRVDGAGASLGTKVERVIGTISGANFVTRTSPASGRAADSTTEQAHTSPVVEMIWNAKDWNDLIDGVLVQHTQAGLHKAITTSQVTASWVVASVVSSSRVVASNITACQITGSSRFVQAYGLYDNGNSGSAATVNWLNGDRQLITISASTTLSWSNAQSGQIMTLIMKENTTGNYSITLPTGKWPSGTATTWGTASASINTLTAMYDGVASQYLYQGSASYA